MYLLLRNWQILAVVAAFFAFSLYVQDKINEAVEKSRVENILEQQEDYIKVRKGIDDAVKNTHGIGGDDATEWLLKRREESRN